MSVGHSIAALCAALEVTPAGYHAWQRPEPGARERADAALAVQIAEVHRAHRGRYGAPRIQRELLADGKAHSRKRIARLLRERGLSAHRPRPGVGERADLRAHRRRLALRRRRARSLEPPGHRLGLCASSLGAEDTALAALRMALRHRRPPRGLIHHSALGYQSPVDFENQLN